MNTALEWIEDGDLLSVPGWRGAAVRTGVKPSGALDLALLVADQPCAAAAVFTRNALPAAPVCLDREALAREPYARSIVINAGNANAMTGARGWEDALAMQRQLEERCGGPALVLSTGVIGVPLPLELVTSGIDAASRELAPRCAQVAEAILTTDTRPNTAALRTVLPGAEDPAARTVTVGGVAKGSGMIHPDMATMLAVVAVDRQVEPGALDGLLRRATDRSFHEISVDGDTSTNDTVLLLAGGGPDLPPLGGSGGGAGDAAFAQLEEAVTAVMQKLAYDIVSDGEGRTRMMELWVRGAASEADARRIADSVACSALVKTALAGGDPNWGRILAAAANAGVPIPLDRLSLKLCGTLVFDRGAPTEYDGPSLDRAFASDAVRVELDLAAGGHTARKWTTDLSAEYVRINSEYTT